MDRPQDQHSNRTGIAKTAKPQNQGVKTKNLNLFLFSFYDIALLRFYATKRPEGYVEIPYKIIPYAMWQKRIKKGVMRKDQ